MRVSLMGFHLRQGRPSRSATFAVFVLVVVGACGGSGGAGIGSKETVEVTSLQLDQECAAAPVPAFGDEPLCADSGLRVAEALAIVNWGGYVYPDDDFGIDEMVALFGSEAVCASYANLQCDERADAALRRTELNLMIAGGRCEGLTTLSSRLALALATPQEVGGVDAASLLTPQSGGVVDVIDYWWATQFNEAVIEETAKYRDLDLEGIVGAVVGGLEGGQGFTMGVYFEGMGHSLLPVAVTSPEQGVYNVWTWDSNIPRTFRPVQVDTVRGVWKFENASANPQIPATTWTGEQGSIDLTPMAVRAGRENASFDGTGTGRVRVSVVPIGRGTAQAVVTAPNGERAGTIDGMTLSEIPGAIVQIHRDGLAKGVTILLPREVGDVTVAVDATVEDGTAEALVTVAAKNRGVTQVSTKSKDQGKKASVQLRVNAGASGIEVEPQDLASATVSVGADRVSVDVPVTAGETLEVQTPDAGKVGVDLQREGQPVFREVVPAPLVGIERVIFDGPNFSKTSVVVPAKPADGAVSLMERVKKSQVAIATTTSATVATTIPKPTSIAAPKSTTTAAKAVGTTTTAKPTSTTVKAATMTTAAKAVGTTTTAKPTSTTVKAATMTTAAKAVGTTTTAKPTSTTVKAATTTTSVKSSLTSTSVKTLFTTTTLKSG